jgi:hypothetical protein
MNDDREPASRTDEPVAFAASLGGRSRAPAIVVAVAIAFVGAFIVRPWQALPAFAPEAAVAPPASTDPAATGDLSGERAPSATERAVQAICLDPGSWRTATIEQWHADQIVRVWRAVELRAASGPTDPTIDVVPAVGEIVPAIGYCAPAVGPDRPPPGPAEVVAWRVAGDVATPIDLRQMAPVGVVSALGALFAPPLDAGAGWPAGTYVFRHTMLASQEARWFAVEVQTDPPPAGRTVRPPPSAVMQPGGGLGAFFLP